MAGLSVPYHPYSTCLSCGEDGVKSENNGSHQVTLNRCSSCKTAPYCSKTCQRNDWNVHRRECLLLQEENQLATALAATNTSFASVTDGQSLRQFLTSSGKDDLAPLKLVLSELKNLLLLSMDHWDRERNLGQLALNRMDYLCAEVSKFERGANWLHLSSVLFGTCMVHNVINIQATEKRMGFGDNAWFQAFIHNFGEVLDRVKLYALLQQNNYSHLLPDFEFPLLHQKEPVSVGGCFFFAPSRIKISKSGKHCMICRKRIEPGTLVISSHDPNRQKGTASANIPRLVNYLPPRTNPFVGKSDDKANSRLKCWLHLVARIKTFPKELVCGEDCEQHALYGRMFDAHPLEKMIN